MMKRLIMAFAASVCMAAAFAQDNCTHIQIGTGLLYEKGWDATLAVDYETRYHNAWEFFGNVYLKWDTCAECSKVCSDSFWHNYNTWSLGIACKPCVYRTRNQHGNLRIGISGGSDRHEALGSAHIGYEHTYTLRHGWQLYWQVRTEAVLNGQDVFKTGITGGVKIPLGQ